MRLPNYITFKPLNQPARAAWVIGAMCAGVALWLAIGAVALAASGSRKEAAAKADLESAASMRRQTLGTTVAGASDTAGVGDASALQSFIEREAAKRGCCISEFRAASTSQPYLSRFTKKPRGAWSQIEVGFSVQGRLPDVYRAISSLCRQEPAFEPSTVDLSRDSVSPAGQASVTARVQGRLVQRRKNKK